MLYLLSLYNYNPQLHYFRFIYLRRFIAFVLMIAVLNTVIDPPDMLRNMDQDAALEEDLSVNEMESLVELVVEKGFDMDNAIPEKEEEDSGDFCKKIEVMQFLKSFEFTPFIQFVVIPHYENFYLAHFSSIPILIDSPPPKG